MRKEARRRLRLALAAALLAGSALAAAPAAAGPTLPELVEVADIVSLAPSPDGRALAFRVERPSIARNSYEIDWYVAELASGETRRVAGGGEPIYGDAGPIEAEPALWSPDGRFFYHRALVDGAIGLWRTAADGSGSGPLVVGDSDVERLSGDSAAGTLSYELGPSRAEIERAERSEYDSGILVDPSVDLAQPLFRGGSVNGRMASQRLSGRWYGRAGLLWRAPRLRYRLDLRTLATAAAERVEPGAAAPLVPSADPGLLLSEQGRPAVRARLIDGAARLELEGSGGTKTCDAEPCRSLPIAALAWRPGTAEIMFTVQDRHYRQSLYLWNVETGRVRLLARGDGLLGGSREPGRPCAMTRSRALCVAAGAVSPPRIEAIDLDSGARSILFDPNAELRRRPAAPVEHLSWPLDGGRTATGTLLLPPPGTPGPAPLFVTYYHCPGYLRGGTGDEFPLAPLADAGFVVACLNMVPLAEPADMVARYDAALASVRGLIAVLTRRGLIDRTRVAMGGFSAGSEATMWTAMNSDLLAAAAIASPQYEPSAYWRDTMRGRDQARVLRDFLGLGTPEETPERWRRISPALNTARIRAPLLMQLPEEEARSAAELHTRLSNTSTPVELYAFPDEGHVKMQPRHRLAAYRRVFDWLGYWLQDRVDPDPAKAEQYRRWDALRRRRDEAQPGNDRSQVSTEASSSSRM